MAVDKEFLKDLIAKHNDRRSTTRINVLVGPSNANIHIKRIYNPEGLAFEPIEVIGEDIVWKSQVTVGMPDRDFSILTYRMGLGDITSLSYFDEGDEFDPETGKPTVPPKPPTEDVAINVRWDNSPLGEKPELKFQLLRDGESHGEEITIDGTRHVWSNLPKEDWDQTPIHRYVYTVKQVNTPDNYKLTVINDGRTFTNTYVPPVIDVSMDLVWANQSGTVPDLDFQLYRNDVAFGNPVTLLEGTTDYTWEKVLKLDEYQNEYVYTIKQVTILEDYELTVDGTTFTNTYVPTVTTGEVTETVDIVAYSTTRNDTEELPKGQEEVVQEGKDGYTEVTYLVTYEDGIEASRKETDRKVVDPVSKIVNVGTYVEPVITVEEVTETVDVVNYNTTRNDTEELPEGQEEVVQKGKNGYTEVTYKVTYEDDVEVKREEIGRETIDPVDEIINVGTYVEPVVTVEEVTETIDIVAYSTTRNDTEELPKGQEEVAQEGVDGYTEVTYKVTYEDGVEVSKEEIGRETIDPVDEIINVGTFEEPEPEPEPEPEEPEED